MCPNNGLACVLLVLQKRFLVTRVWHSGVPHIVMQHTPMQLRLCGCTVSHVSRLACASEHQREKLHGWEDSTQRHL